MDSIFICTLPRTGSSLLSADMRGTGALGNPREYFNPPRRLRLKDEWDIDVDDMATYAQALVERTATSNGVFAAKLMATHCPMLKRDGLLRGDAGLLRELAGYFGSVRIVRLTRKDKLRQAISLAKARQTGSWGAGIEPERQPVYKRAEIAQIIVQIATWEAQWNREFEASGMWPELDLEYEDLPTNRHLVLRQVGSLLGIHDLDTTKQDQEEVRLVKQSDETTEEWVDQFIAGKG